MKHGKSSLIDTENSTFRKGSDKSGRETYIGIYLCRRRIDYFITSKRMNDKLTGAKIHTDVFGSDHCPVELDIDLS